jgi:hypothetical protein
VSAVALRTSLIWHDEVMGDVVLDKPRKITLGHSRRSTFVVPDIGLPAEFAIVRPGNRGYLLTLGEQMRGTICLDGQERDVAEFVRRKDDSDGRGEFRATPISGRDWGVIHLDESGDLKLFFQFVPVEEPAQFFTPIVLAAGGGGFLLASAVLTLLWWLNDQPIEEAIFRGVGMSTIVLALAAVGWWAYLQDNEQKASLVFSIVLHLALLFTTYRLYNGENPFVWPGPRALTGNYLVTRLDVTPPPEPPKQESTFGAVKQEAAAPVNPSPTPANTATKGPEGAFGGKGATERSRAPNPRSIPTNMARNIEKVLARDLKTSLGKFASIEGPSRTGPMGYGTGTGIGVGDGVGGTGTTRGGKGGGPGGNGGVEGDHVSTKGPLNTGPQRPGGKCVGADCKGTGPREISVAVGEMSGDPGGLSAEEINQKVKSKGGVFRACYQKELNRSPGIGGKLVIRFKIGGNGVVKDAAVAGGSTLANAGVSECVIRNVNSLKFRAVGGISNVTYPFVFSPGG